MKSLVRMMSCLKREQSLQCPSPAARLQDRLITGHTKQQQQLRSCMPRCKALAGALHAHSWRSSSTRSQEASQGLWVTGVCAVMCGSAYNLRSAVMHTCTGMQHLTFISKLPLASQPASTIHNWPHCTRQSKHTIFHSSGTLEGPMCPVCH